MSSGQLFPVGLRLAGRRCVVVGGGELAHRRVAGLLEAGARIILISPETTPALEALTSSGTLRWERRPYEDGDLIGAWYVLAATGIDAIDSAVAAHAEATHIFCTRGTDPIESSAVLPANERSEPTTRPGVALVGDGPGDPGLLTLRGFVPGVTSALAVPAMAGIPVTHRGMAHEFVVVSGHLPPGHPESLVDWPALGRLRGTIVILMGVHNAAVFAAALIEHGREPDTATVAICNGGLPGGRVLRMTLSAVGAVAAAENIQPPAVLVAGAVAALADRSGR